MHNWLLMLRQLPSSPRCSVQTSVCCGPILAYQWQHLAGVQQLLVESKVFISIRHCIEKFYQWMWVQSDSSLWSSGAALLNSKIDGVSKTTKWHWNMHDISHSLDHIQCVVSNGGDDFAVDAPEGTWHMGAAILAPPFGRQDMWALFWSWTFRHYCDF